MWGIIPAAGAGTRLQPLGFSKELLPAGRHLDEGRERPRAVSEYLVDRMIRGGASHLCFVIGPHKSDIIEYYGERVRTPAEICYVVQPRPAGLCDAVFRALPFIPPAESALIGLPDTVWFPEDGFRALTAAPLSFLLFPVARPELFDAVVTDECGSVREVQVKSATARSSWIWGGIRASGEALRQLHELWRARNRQDEYLGTLVNAWLARGGEAQGIRAGQSYLDVGTVDGYQRVIESFFVGAEARSEK
jgi:dTDP-glucose pyrophosphorylase